MQKVFSSDFDFDTTIRYNSMHRKNNIIIIVGKQRSGKTYAGLKLCETYDEKFNKDAVCFDMKKFMKFIQKKRNRWVLFDEVGLEFDNILWYTLPARIIKYVCETYASRQINLVMTLPHLANLGLHIKTLSHFIIRMFRPKYGVLIGISTDYIHTGLYYKWLQWLEFGYPSQEVVKDYERLKDNFLTDKSFEWCKELGLVDDPQQKKLKQLKMIIGSGTLKGDAYRSVFNEYIKLKEKVG